MTLKSAFLSFSFAVLLLPATGQLPRAASPLKQPTAQQIEEMREALRARQAEREALNGRQILVPWQRLADSPDQLAGDKKVLVRLANQMNLYRAVWTFTPAGGGGAVRPVRVLQCWRGEQWIALEPGEWNATVTVGRPTGGRAIRLPLAPLSGRRRQVYELALTGSVEQAVAAMERADERKRAEAAKHLQATDEEKRKDGAPPE